MTILEYAICCLLINGCYLSIVRFIQYLIEKNMPENYKSSNEIPLHILEERIRVRAYSEF